MQFCLPQSLSRTSTAFGLALALTGFALSPNAAFARDTSTPSLFDVAALEFAPDLRQFTLDNGLQIVVIPDHRAPVATHMIWYKVGAADEPEGQSGVAHFLEHLMFKGTTKHPDGEFSKTVAEIGGQENAFTSADYTAYFQKVGKEHLALMMEMEADRMHNLILTDEVVKPERDVVLEERRSRVDTEPGARLGEALSAITFVNHPYGSPIIGWRSEIEALNKEAALAFYDRFYTPNNAILVVAGDVEPDEVLDMARNTYGKVPRRAEPGVRSRPAEPPLAGLRRTELQDPRVTQEQMSQIRLVPSDATAAEREAEALELLSYILGGTSNSRLYKALVLDQKTALGAGSYYQSTALDHGQFGIYASPRPDVSLEDIERQVNAVIDDLLDGGISEEELARAKHSMIASTIYAQDSQSSLARIFGTALTTGLTVKDVQSWPKRIQEVTAEDVMSVAKTYLVRDPVIGYLRKPDNDQVEKKS